MTTITREVEIDLEGQELRVEVSIEARSEGVAVVSVDSVERWEGGGWRELLTRGAQLVHLPEIARLAEEALADDFENVAAEIVDIEEWESAEARGDAEREGE